MVQTESKPRERLLDAAIDYVAAHGISDLSLRELAAAGGALISLNPVRETLEDVFVRRVAEMGEGARPSTSAGVEK